VTREVIISEAKRWREASDLKICKLNEKEKNICPCNLIKLQEKLNNIAYLWLRISWMWPCFLLRINH